MGQMWQGELNGATAVRGGSPRRAGPFAVASFGLILAVAATACSSDQQPIREVVESGDGWAVAVTGDGSELCVEVADQEGDAVRCTEPQPGLDDAVVESRGDDGARGVVVFGLLPRGATRVGGVFRPRWAPLSEAPVNMWAETADVGMPTPAFVLRPPWVERCLTLVAVSEAGRTVQVRQNAIGDAECQ